MIRHRDPGQPHDPLVQIDITLTLRLVMLTFPRSLVPVDGDTVQPLVGALMPRSLSGRGLIAQFLGELTESAATDDIRLSEPAITGDPGLAEVLCKCVVGLIRQRLGELSGITPHTRRLLQQERIKGIVRRHLDNPALDPEGIAKAANISQSYLHRIFRGADLTPMRLLKQLRLQEAHRMLQDSALANRAIKDIGSAVGYVRADQFSWDFRQLFGVSPRAARLLAVERVRAGRPGSPKSVATVPGGCQDSCGQGA